MNNKRKYYDVLYEYNINKKGKKEKKDKNNKNEKNDDEISINESIQNDLSNLLGKKNKDTKIERDNNHVYFHSEVDRESIFELVMLIKEAEEESMLTSFKLNIDVIPIYLHINSFGGSIFAAFSAIDVIKACRVPVYTIIEGSTASAGTLISIVGKKRYIRPNAFMLIHQLSSGCWGKMSEIEDEYKNLQELMERIKEIYKEYTNIPKKELNDLLKHDLWLNSSKCLKYGLAEEIWDK
jgi:ATP-dependent Clp endopeptidase proteolytic subunit ClpP